MIYNVEFYFPQGVNAIFIYYFYSLKNLVLSIHLYPVKFFIIFLGLLFSFNAFSQNVRKDILLNKGWRSIADDHDKKAFQGFEQPDFKDDNWKQVDVPHNWDNYEGYRRKRHGNKHGYAWYRKSFHVEPKKSGQRYFLFFEGVGSYATVWLNGKEVGQHAGGRTTFTLDVTEAIQLGKANLLAVRAHHPAEIRDLPWVCGGCSTERGFSEGSQPMGIFRPVHLIVTDQLRIMPFGVHVWNDSTISETSAALNIETEIKNYGNKSRNIVLVNRLEDKAGKTITEVKEKTKIHPDATALIRQKTPSIDNPHLWSLEDPYLYTLVSEVVENGKVIDRLRTPYGIRWISWPIGRSSDDKRFFLNGKPVFINGVGGYEHALGKSHAFTKEQIRTRALQIKAAGFNAFRDAHQPHNLRYQQHWDSLGILLWTQISAHIWFDTPEFRENFKTLLKDWVKERRNNPSVVMWGLQNESRLPAEFARECTELIRELDPTASSQRLVVTCNGGTGTDWDVPQNWTGTYGGNPATYDEDVQRQVLIGEYGAWRTLDLHAEGPFDQDGIPSEDRMTHLMEMKVRLAESVHDKSSGHFFWIFASHDNPGRVQAGEGYRELDRIGPVNYKGLLTPWGEPTDVFYMYRSNYAPQDKEPMVYIASHTWPDRWLAPGMKDSIHVYSNCEEVELFNDVNGRSLGKRTREGIGTHFQWDDVDIQYNVLYAVGYNDGKAVARDYIVLNHLPKALNFDKFLKDAKPITAPQPGYNYLYRVNSGGPDYVDENGNTWMADFQRTDMDTWGSTSWTEEFQDMSAFFASQRRTHDPITGTVDWDLFQNFRYGREKLRYEFPVPDGEYLVELYFTEPWLGTGGGMDCEGWRLFDVAINDETVIKDLDIWKEAGHDTALKKTVKAKVNGGQLTISFPRVASGQALISAIAIATTDPEITPAPAPQSMIKELKITDQKAAHHWSVNSWMDTGYKQYSDEKIAFSALPPELYGMEWIQPPRLAKKEDQDYLAKFQLSEDADVYIAIDEAVAQTPAWLKAYTHTNTFIETDLKGGHKFVVYHKLFPKGTTVVLGDRGKVPGGDAEMYTVAVNKANKMDPPYDLKPSTGYYANKANLIGSGIIKETVNGKENVTFKRAAGDSIEWTVTVGVADIYAFEVRYHNPLKRNLSAKFEILANDGTLMKEAVVECTPTRKGKWNYFNTTTGNMINAGNYIIRLISIDAENLSIRDISVR